MKTAALKSPFPAFGGKSRIADRVWARFGDVRNAIEPFAFSAAWMLRRPGGAGAIETINDRNAFVSNFWRAVQSDPEAVARHADWPVNETDLHARHRWLVGSDKAAAILQAVKDDPDAYDARIAGWWCLGACCWIGSGWCDENHRNSRSESRPMLSQQLPAIGGDAGACGSGVVASAGHKKPNHRRPGMSQAGWGINATGSDQHEKRVRLASFDTPGLGVNAGKRPGLCNGNTTAGPGVLAHADDDGETGTCENRRRWITDWMLRLADRLRTVRVCCGHWSRVCDSPSTMTNLGLTGVFLDPPYRTSLACGKANRSKHIYASDKVQDVNALCDEVQEWCLRWGPDPEVRIALCGLDGEYPAIEAAGWTVEAWKSNGGYGNRKGDGVANENAAREQVWYSPHCLTADVNAGGLFA